MHHNSVLLRQREGMKRKCTAAARCKTWVCGRSLAGIARSNPAGAWLSVSCDFCVLSGRGLCDGPITCPRESYRLCLGVCVIECDQTTIILTPYSEQVEKAGLRKKGRKKEKRKKERKKERKKK